MGRKIDLNWLLRVRVVVGRCGEMDAQRWWNTEGQLGPYGARVFKRGFPRTHYFAQARSVFAVAAHRCAEVFDPPGAATFWRLPDEVEEAFDARWEGWLVERLSEPAEAPLSRRRRRSDRCRHVGACRRRRPNGRCRHRLQLQTGSKGRPQDRRCSRRPRADAVCHDNERWQSISVEACRIRRRGAGK